MKHLSLSELRQIEDRLSLIPQGGYRLHSIGVKNYLLWVGGDWPEEKDDDIFEFFSHAASDVANLIRDAKLYRSYNEEMQSLCYLQELEIEKLKNELKTIKGG